MVALRNLKKTNTHTKVNTNPNGVMSKQLIEEEKESFFFHIPLWGKMKENQKRISEEKRGMKTRDEVLRGMRNWREPNLVVACMRILCALRE